MYTKNLENVIRKPMTFEELCPIWNRIQKQQAKMQIRKVDRAKMQLTHEEQLNKFAQLGGYVVCDKAIFTYDKTMGMGLLITPKRKILGATISDFLAIARA